MTVKAHRVEGGSATDGYGYGLFCRADGQENLYAFTIWANHATIEKRIHGQAFQEPGVPMTEVTAAPEGDSEKELQAVCRTNQRRALLGSSNSGWITSSFLVRTVW